MKLHSGLARRFVLLFTPLVSSSIIVVLPSQAATLAFSQGSLRFNNFSQNLQATQTFTDTDTDINTFPVAEPRSPNTAVARASATFETDPPMSFNTSFGKASGQGSNSFGLAKGKSRAIGNFFLEAGESFSFDFIASLKLKTSIDNYESEFASARGDLTLLGINNTNKSVYDYFKLFGGLKTQRSDDYLRLLVDENVTLTNYLSDTRSSGIEELAQASIAGTLQQSFSHPTSLTLLAITRNRATTHVPKLSGSSPKLLAATKNRAVTQVPEPSSSFAISCLVFIYIGSRVVGLKPLKDSIDSLTTRSRARY